MPDDEFSDALSEATTSVSTLSKSTLRTASEVHPDDSASRRLRLRGSGNGAGPDRTHIRDAESAERSVTSIHTTDYEDLYKAIGNRTFNAQSDVYALPADDEEHSRLDMQHISLCLWLNSLYPFKLLVEDRLREGQERTPNILDIGTGSGRWAVDMAMAYPWAQVVGIDLVPPALLSRGKIPENVHFEVDNMNLSMEHYVESFDVVHARFIEAGLNDGRSFLYEVAQSLKPNGVVVLGAGDLQFWTEDLEPLFWVEPGQPGFSWVQYLAGHIFQANWRRGATGLTHRLYYKDWISANLNYSEDLEEVVYIPVGPWKDGLDQRETMASNMLREDLARLFTAYSHLLTTDGHSETDILTWTREATKELKDMSTRLMCRFIFVAGVRSAAPWRPNEGTVDDIPKRSLIQGISLY